MMARLSRGGLSSRAGPAKSRRVHNAFILGAGLGNRLRPLTDHLPKPLVPLFHRPLAQWTMEACRRAGIRRFAINTHHLPDAWRGFGGGRDVTLFNEPILLETGGGLKNIGPWIGSKPLLVHNGDIFSTLPIEKLIAAHEASGLPVTLAVRSHGIANHIALDVDGTRVKDIRNLLGQAEGTHVFSGIYCINAEFLELLPAGEKISVIPAFLELAKQGRLGAIVLNEGVWLDLGDRESYLLAHRELALAPSIHPEALVSPAAVVENSVIGAGAVIGTGAVVKDSVVWAGGRVGTDARLHSCIVCSGNEVRGVHKNSDL